MTPRPAVAVSLTDEEIPLVAHYLYLDHPAALPLLQSIAHGETWEDQYRALRALQWLDPWAQQFPEDLPPREDAAVRAVRWCIYGERIEDRKRAAADAVRLLHELAAEAAA